MIGDRELAAKIRRRVEKLRRAVNNVSETDIRQQMDELLIQLLALVGSNVEVKSSEDYCRKCGHPWEEHEMGVPAPYCPLGDCV